MMQFILAAAAILLLSLPSVTFAFGGCEQDCLKCHKISSQEAETVLKPLVSDAEVQKVSIAPAKGLWEIVFKSGGKSNIAYVDFSLQNIILGQIVQIKTKTNLTLERMIEINKVDFSSIPLDNALVIGNRKALHKVVVFSDPDCPYCGTLHQGIKQIIEKRKDIVFYIKLYPLPIHKDARRKAESIMCSHSLRMLDEAFEKKNIPDSTCTQTFIDHNIALAQKLGITGTPTIILDDGRMIPAFVQPDKLLALIDRRPL